MDKFMEHDFNISAVLLACLVKKGTGQAVHRGRKGHGIVYNRFGTKKYSFSTGEVITVSDDEVIYLPKGSSYEVYGFPDGDCYCINFDTAADDSFSPFAVKVREKSLLLDLFKSAKQHWDLKNFGYMTKCKSLLYDVLYQLQKEHFLSYMPKSSFDKIKEAVDYIHLNYHSKPISVNELSHMCSMSPEYFRRIFGSFYGTSPNKYIKTLMLQRAKEHLLSGLYSVSECCFLSGFNDESYFSRQFKKHFGVSPSRFKDMYDD